MCANTGYLIVGSHNPMLINTNEIKERNEAKGDHKDLHANSSAATDFMDSATNSQMKARQKQAKKRRVLFSKRLTHTDTFKRLAIPTKSLAFLPRFCGGHALELLVRDDDGRCWTFGCSIRKTGAYQKPVFQQCWRQFVVAKCLSVGDKVTFYKEAAAEDGIRIFGSVFHFPRYGIEIEKAMRSPSTSSGDAADHLGYSTPISNGSLMIKNVA